MAYRIRNWRRFQHYKDRNPPWIKLHTSILVDRDFMALDFCSQGLLVQLWVLASESKDGTVSSSPDELSFRLRKIVTSVMLKPLLKKFLICIDNPEIPLADASNMLAVAVPETEGEGETEREPPLVSTQGPPEGGSAGLSESQTSGNGNGNGHRKSKRFSKPTLEEVEAFIAESGYSIDAESWYAHYEANGWRVGKTPMVKWKAAVHTWQRRRDEGGI